MRSLSLSFQQSHNDEATGAEDILLVTIDHDDLATPIRLASGWTTRFSTEPLRYGVTSRGQQYDFLPFAWKLPEDGEEAPAELPLQIANFSQDLIVLLESTTTPAVVTCEVVAAATPDDVEMVLPVLDLMRMDFDGATVTINLAVDSLVNEPVPAHSFTPGYFPGMF